MDEDIAWAIETSKDGDRWRFFGKGWTRPGEPLILHGAPKFVRYRRVDRDEEWCSPLERSGDHPMTLLRLDEGAREDLWPESEHLGLPVLLPGGEAGRLLRFERSDDGERWTYALEFRGSRKKS